MVETAARKAKVLPPVWMTEATTNEFVVSCVCVLKTRRMSFSGGAQHSKKCSVVSTVCKGRHYLHRRYGYPRDTIGRDGKALALLWVMCDLRPPYLSLYPSFNVLPLLTLRLTLHSVPLPFSLPISLALPSPPIILPPSLPLLPSLAPVPSLRSVSLAAVSRSTSSTCRPWWSASRC